LVFAPQEQEKSMLFDQDKDKGEKETKKRSIWGTLFNPDIGNDIRPLAESTRMFVQMIAMILAAQLFPKTTPRCAIRTRG
jgi:hypothetical protein